MPEPSVLIPLHKRGGIIRGHTLVDQADAHYGDQKWYVDKHGYVYHYVLLENGRYRMLFLHRAVLGLEHGDPLCADHINGNPLDNRRSNLRAVTLAQNAQNIRTIREGSQSRYRGVTFMKSHNAWRARIQVDGKMMHLGYFRDEAVADAAAREARRRYMPFAVDR